MSILKRKALWARIIQSVITAAATAWAFNTPGAPWWLPAGAFVILVALSVREILNHRRSRRDADATPAQ